MTEVAFHFNVSDKLGYACRLLRKAAARRTPVVVTGASDALHSLDAALWTFSAQDFVAHCDDQAPAAVRQRSPIVLSALPAGQAGREVLVNLGDQVPAGFESYPRLIEIVSADEADRQSARLRWKHYADRGYAMVRHDCTGQ